MNVRFCPSCRSLILADFRFCPYCGTAIKGPGLSEILDRPLDSMSLGGADIARASRDDIFAVAEENLRRLETDMDLLLEELEREGRSSTQY